MFCDSYRLPDYKSASKGHADRRTTELLWHVYRVWRNALRGKNVINGGCDLQKTIDYIILCSLTKDYQPHDIGLTYTICCYHDNVQMFDAPVIKEFCSTVKRAMLAVPGMFQEIATKLDTQQNCRSIDRKRNSTVATLWRTQLAATVTALAVFVVNIFHVQIAGLLQLHI